MEDVFDTLAIGISATLFFGVIFAFIAFMRWLRYKETVELARQGLLHPRYQARDNRRMSSSRRSGTFIMAIGIAMTLGLGTIGLDPHNTLLGPWLLGGLIPLAVGASLWFLGDSEGGGNSAEINSQDDDPIPPHKR